MRELDCKCTAEDMPNNSFKAAVVDNVACSRMRQRITADHPSRCSDRGRRRPLRASPLQAAACAASHTLACLRRKPHHFKSMLNRWRRRTNRVRITCVNADGRVTFSVQISLSKRIRAHP